MKRLSCIAIASVFVLLTGCESRGLIKPSPNAPPAASTPRAVDPAPAPELGVQAEIVAHLDNATAIATAGNDPSGAQCWVAAKAWVLTLPIPAAPTTTDVVLPPATGPSGVVETARIKVKAVQARIAAGKAKLAALKAIVDNGFPDSVVTACAIVTYDYRVLRDKVLGLIGLGALAVNPATAAEAATAVTIINAQ